MDELKITRLVSAVEASYRELDPFRTVTHKLISDYSGSGYGKTRQPEVMVNLTAQTVGAYIMSLAANRPRALFSTRQIQHTYFAKVFEAAANSLFEEIRLEETIRRLVLDAFFGLGVCKVHTAASGLVQVQPDLWMDPGRPFASNVHLDNFVFDLTATKYSEVKFAGDCYRVPFDDLKKMGFDEAVVNQLMPTSKYSGGGEERVREISRGSQVDSDELEPHIDLIDIWLPREQTVNTFAVKNIRQMQINRAGLLASIPWDGPEFGPYHLLGFDEVPENIMPISPALQLEPMNRLINNVYRKESKRAKNLKNVHAFESSSEPDAKRLQSASDEEWVGCNNVEGIKDVRSGTLDPALSQFKLGVMADYDRMAGNLQAILGLGSQAETLGQENLIHASSNRRIAQMAYRVASATENIMRSLTHLLWLDQQKVIPNRLPVAEGYSIDATWKPDQREGDFAEYELSISPYSQAYQSPQEKVSKMSQIISQEIVPLVQAIPVAAQAGVVINLEKYVDLIGKWANIPEISQVITFSQPMPAPGDEPPAQASPAGKPASTRREYVRRSASTSQGQNIQRQQALASMAADNNSGSGGQA
jgi:hypothetical protein